MFRFLLIFFSCLGFSISHAQTEKINALRHELVTMNNLQQQLTYLFLLCDESESLNTDTLTSYAWSAKKLAAQLKDNTALLRADYFIAYSFYQKSLPDSSSNIVNRNLPGLQKTNAGDLYFKYLLLKGRIAMRRQDMKAALTCYYEVLSKAETNKDTLNQVMAMSGIGWVQKRMVDSKESLAWFLRAIQLAKNPVHRDKTIFLYINTAVVYNTLENYDSANYYAKKGIVLARQANDLTDLANALGFYAGNMIDTKHFTEAEASLKEAVEVRKQLGNPYDLITDMETLAIYYADTHQPKKGIDLSLKAIDEAKKYDMPSKFPSLYEGLAKNYYMAGDFKKYGETMQLLADVKDSIYQQNSSHDLAEMKTRFEVQKKENTIILQQLSLVKKDYFIYGGGLLVIILLVAASLLFLNYKKRQQLKASLAVSRAEETERKRIAADLHDNLGAYAASIASAVNHISSNDPSKNIEVLKELKNNSNAIVSDLSDTIWALKKESLHLTAISDRLKLFIQRVHPGYPGILIDVHEDISSDHELSPSQGFHLFQIIQEAVNNALKHSGCSEVIIDVKGNSSDWKITISDNGNGLSKEIKSDGGGNGLYNMKNRANEAGWTIGWEANHPNGTIVDIMNSPLMA
ncbi:MAG: hypothetical protein JWN76_1807 [Chitinophagaceae bacterium]|nr:hypothetical protein [Chitinophagaceae bacterium]